ncbi:immunity 26/phosphotriesterase HocA family protein [Kribbella sp. NPDC020789]
MQVLKASRSKLRRGDVFALQPRGRRYLFGRIVDTETIIGPMTDCLLIYVYRVQSEVKELPAAAELMPVNLLLPPMMTNRLPWSRGYFETIGHQEIDPGMTLDVHCFRGPDGRFYDEKSHELPGPVEPVGVHALKSHRTIDDAVSKALGIPRAPD